MNTQPPMSPSPSPIFPDELIIEILSWLTVKPLMKMKRVSKSWNSFISDSKFVKMHLNRSARHSQSYLVSKQPDDYSFVPFSVNALLENRSINLPNDPYYRLFDKDCRQVVGSCNGLVCLLGYSVHEDYDDEDDEEDHKETWLRIWNPATRTISHKFRYFRDDMYQLKFWEFMFGYDNSTDTYNIVALNTGINRTTEVRVLSFGNNIWRNIQSFPVGLLQLSFYDNRRSYAGVHLNCTVNWLAIITDGNLATQIVILSLDLGTETYTQLLPPPVSLELSHVIVSLEVSCARPGVCVLNDSLCFYHDFEETDFVIWKMTEFGDEKSWAQLMKFSYHSLQMNLKHVTSIFNLYVNGDTLVFTGDQKDRAILYNLRNNRVVKTRVNRKLCWFSIDHYVESLVSTN